MALSQREGRDESILKSITPKRGDGTESGGGEFLETDLAKLYKLEEYGGLDQTEDAINRDAEEYLGADPDSLSEDSWYKLRQAAQADLPHELTEYFVRGIGDRNARVVVSPDKKKAVVKTFAHGVGYRVFTVRTLEGVQDVTVDKDL
jgi:hypothetical protein